MALPPSWKGDVDKTINEAIARYADAQDRADEQSREIATRIEALTDELKRYNAKQEGEEPRKRTRENWTIAGLIATAVFTFALAIFSLWQVLESRRAYEPIKESADAAKQSAEVSRNTLILAQRAVVIIRQTESVAIGTPTEGWAFQIVFKNAGQTTAKDIRMAARFEFFDKILPDDYNFVFERPDDALKSATPIDAGRDTEFRSQKVASRIDNLKKVLEKKGTLLYGFYVTYRDVFKGTAEHHIAARAFGLIWFAIPEALRVRSTPMYFGSPATEAL
jgi:hypothetical protein